MKEYFIRIDNSYERLGLEIRIGYYDKQARKGYVFVGREIKEVDEFEQFPVSLYIPIPYPGGEEIARGLLDGLIKQGIQPTQPIKNTQELEAVKYHLEDMRKIVFKPNSEVR